jgi:hypothetical protein
MKLFFKSIKRNAFEGAAEYAPITIEQAQEIVDAGGYDDFPINKYLGQKMIECARDKNEQLELVLEYGCPDHKKHCWLWVHA